MTNNDEIDIDRSQISVQGIVMTEAILRENLQLINNENMTTNKYIEIFPYNKNIELNIGDDHEFIKEDDHCIYLYVRGMANIKTEFDPMFEAVQHAMLVWLYLCGKQLPYSIIAIEISYSSWSLNAEELIMLTRFDFEHVHKQLPQSEMDVYAYAAELSRLWIESYA